MRTNVKMKCNDSQFRQAMKILKIDYQTQYYYEDMYVIVNNDLNVDFGYGGTIYNESGCKEIDADLFIRTNGTCEDESTLNDDDIARILKASKDQPREYLKQKIVNLHDQLNKYRKTVQNQKEELTRLLSQKEKMQQMLMMPCKSVDNDNLVKELEEKYTIIKYLESKLYN